MMKYNTSLGVCQPPNIAFLRASTIGPISFVTAWNIAPSSSIVVTTGEYWTISLLFSILDAGKHRNEVEPRLPVVRRL